MKIRLGQKVGLCAFLSLSICMAAVSAVRVGGERYHQNYDFTWLFFWMQVEASIAVSVVSLTAFPAVFLSTAASRGSSGRASQGQGQGQGQGQQQRWWYSSSIGRLRNREKLRSTDDFTDASTQSEWPQHPAPSAFGHRAGEGIRQSGMYRGDGAEEEMEMEMEMSLGPHAQQQPGGQVDLPMENLRERKQSIEMRGDDHV